MLVECLAKCLNVSSLSPFADSDAEEIREIMETLQTIKAVPGAQTAADRRSAMSRLIRTCREARTAAVADNFRSVLRLLIENLADESGATRALVFGVLTEMLKRAELISSFQAFMELIILKVLEAHRDSEKDVSWKINQPPLNCF